MYLQIIYFYVFSVNFLDLHIFLSWFLYFFQTTDADIKFYADASWIRIFDASLIQCIDSILGNQFNVSIQHHQYWKINLSPFYAEYKNNWNSRQNYRLNLFMSSLVGKFLQVGHKLFKKKKHLEDFFYVIYKYLNIYYCKYYCK